MFLNAPYTERADEVLTHPVSSNPNGSRKDHVMATKRICSIPNCGKRHKAHGWCSSHYHRYRVHGDPNGGETAWGEAQAFLESVLADRTDECISWPFSTNVHGRPKVFADGRVRTAARVVCERVHGIPPTPEHEAAHSCGSGGCVNPRHLRWATRAENEADKLDHGTHNRGEQHNMVKLKESDVIDIRRRVAAGESQRAIAREYRLGQPTVSKIVRRERWAWLQDSQMG